MKSDPVPAWFSRLDYIFVLRPMLFFPGWSTMLAGYFINHNDRFYIFMISPAEINYLKIFLLITGFGMLMGSTFILNQIKDIQTDRENNKLFIIANRYISIKAAVFEAFILTLFSLVLAFYVNITILVLFICFFLLTGIFYNYYPFILKDRPWGSLLANALMGWLAFAIGWAACSRMDWQIIIQSLPYLLFNTALYLFTTLPDIAGDKNAIKQTLAVKYGIKPLIIFALILFTTGFILSIYYEDLQALFFYICSFPFFVRTIYSLKVESAIQTTKFGILFFALTICLKWPLYFILMISGFYLTKLYFRKRFSFNYPNFSGK